MLYWKATTVVLLMFLTFHNGFGTDTGAGTQTISEMIKNSGYTNEFFSMIMKSANLEMMLGGNSGIMYTVFVPTTHAFGNLTLEKREEILNMDSHNTENFVKFYCIHREQFQINDNSVRDTIIKHSEAADSNNLFIQKRTRTSNIGGMTGMTQFYVNGAYISEPNKFATNGLVHYIDRVLDISSNKMVYGYLVEPTDPNIKAKISEFSRLITENPLIYTNPQFADVIQTMKTKDKLTMFIPSNDAVKKIPSDKLTDLKTNIPKFIQMLKSHIILDQVVYTDYLEQNEPFQGYDGTIFMRKNTLDQVFVSSNYAVGKITIGNITAGNGAIHILDTMLGFVYFTAMEQITYDKSLSKFAELIRRGRDDIKNALQNTIDKGLTVFVPVDSAFTYINSLPQVNFNNEELLNMVLNIHVLEPGDRLMLSQVPGGFSERLVRLSRYNRKSIMVYNEKNETWVQGLHVKARVIRRDVGVKNGIIHYIDAVLGIPCQDIPTIIYYEEWLMRSYDALCTANLVSYLRDPAFNPLIAMKPQNPWLMYSSRSDCSYNRGGSISDYTNMGRQQFTIFIPNGTAIINFQRYPQGQKIMADVPLFQHVLKRLILRQAIYIEDLRRGYSRFSSDNGDQITIYKYLDRYAELWYRDKKVRLLHWDVGATNGVVHIVDPLLFVSEDSDGSSASRLTSNNYVLLQSVITLMILLTENYR